ncbi:hypothetical protein [Simkania negevensis]|uniref:Peptidase MA-like domain-containing protein n=1 Tax=Simkania negevensis (strain ATCC VR-1471 / DSM 27360 / Z) TaxID=331113 RepID=F8L4A2_SIMNZ|nr:hypothetical protein [Simkania negevensis]CCB90151.1 hypothetical protein, putative type III secreted [Simkania negevensis Z]
MILEKLKELGEAGWIIGPDETVEGFVKRIDIQMSFSKGNLESIAESSEVMRQIRERLHVHPSWIQVRYSNKGLKPWEGAASWIMDYGNWIQLRTSFKKGSLLTYQREEVIFHEAIHSLRFTFEEPRFEEIIAYAFTKKRWRRYLGPLFTTPKQAYIFLTTLFLTPFAPIIPSGYLLWRVGVLIRNQRLFKKALKKIQTLFPKTSSHAVILRMTDAEIQLFAKQDLKTLEDYIQFQSDNLRWQQLLANLKNPLTMTL